MRSLSFQMVALCVAMVLLGGLPAFYFAYNETRRSIESNVRETLLRETSVTMAAIDRFLYERQKDLFSLTQDPLLRSLSAGQGSAQIALLQTRLKELSAAYPLYKTLSYFDVQRTCIADSYKENIGKKHTFSKFWPQLQQSDFAIEVSRSEFLKIPVIHFARKIYDTNKKHAGVLVAQVAMSELYELFNHIITSFGAQEEELRKNLEITLVDADGFILFSNQNKFIALTKRYPDIKLIKKLIEESNAGSANRFLNAEKEIYVIDQQKGYLDYTGNGWIIIAKASKDIIFKPASMLSDRYARIALIVCSIGVVIAIVVGRYFAQPIVSLHQAAEEMAQGEWNEIISDDSMFRRRDEIGELARSFRHMSYQLDKKIKEQKELNLQLRLKYEEVQQKTEEIQSQNEKIAQQKDEIEKALSEIKQKNKNITASINYAQRIQSAMLPEKEAIRRCFEQVFIFYKPKDIVSGDFYWFRQTVNGQGEPIAVMAVVDCTGHGVPGALMSVIGNNLLHQIVVMEGILDPAQIIRKMDVGVIKTLKQDTASSNRQDGMDISIITYNHQHRQLVIAGAHQSAYIVRQDTLHEIKGDKFSVGGIINTKTSRTVHNHYWQCLPGDMLYLCTDGYTDQFGNADGGAHPVKLGKKFFRQLLKDIYQADLNRQEAILAETYEMWRGSEEQTDDITIIGIRF
ncbi:MAG: SpoIIE family protein phosphatase [Cytophagales bacterium]|nr:SpoIIE family protein phosphatase [Bernardetiaceae bacterium]MDW8210315.1 SpoIIE family protein phosphatase [Cytophagales bacterium]